MNVPPTVTTVTLTLRPAWTLCTPGSAHVHLVTKEEEMVFAEVRTRQEYLRVSAVNNMILLADSSTGYLIVGVLQLHVVLFSDINECTTDANNCQEFCHNTPGGFHCSCLSGYELTTDNKCRGGYQVS